MCVREGGGYGEVAAYKEAHPRYGEVMASVKDVPEIEECAAVGA
jgi:hypothetical protein